MSGSTSQAAGGIAWRTEVPRAARHALSALPWVWRSNRPAVAGMMAITLISGLLPAAQAFVGKLIVDAVVAAVGHAGIGGSGWEAFRSAVQPVALYLGLEFALILAGAICGQARSALHFVVDQNLRHELNQKIMHKSLQLDLSFFEDSEFYDKLQQAGRQSDWRMMAVVDAGFSIAQTLISLASLLALLVTFSPWIALLIFGSVVPSLLMQSRLSRQRFAMESARTADVRRLAYYELSVTDNDKAKEIRLFGLGPEFIRRYAEIFRRMFRLELQLMRRRIFTTLGLGMLSSAAYYVAYAWIVYKTIVRVLSLGDLTMYLAVVRQCQGLFESLFGGLSGLYEHALFLGKLHDFLAMEPRVKESPDARPVPRPFAQGIEFRNVTFQYAKNDSPTLKNISVSIRPGEKIAIVGANGAGKTTFIKLLTRLYDPTAGEITIDGVSLRDYRLDSLHARFGVIFQDFVRFEATLRENIALGQVEAEKDEARMLEAARKGGADVVAAASAEGLRHAAGELV